MAESFNLTNFLNTYKGMMEKKYTPAENAQAAMEERAVKQAEEAVKDSGFLTLTLTEKLEELGLGGRVAQQLGDTALNFLKSFVNPVTDYLETYQNIFDQQAYNAEIQSYAKQMFFANQAMLEESKQQEGQNFFYTM